MFAAASLVSLLVALLIAVIVVVIISKVCDMLGLDSNVKLILLLAAIILFVLYVVR